MSVAIALFALFVCASSSEEPSAFLETDALVPEDVRVGTPKVLLPPPNHLYSTCMQGASPRAQDHGPIAIRNKIPKDVPEPEVKKPAKVPHTPTPNALTCMW